MDIKKIEINVNNLLDNLDVYEMYLRYIEINLSLCSTTDMFSRVGSF